MKRPAPHACFASVTAGLLVVVSLTTIAAHAQDLQPQPAEIWVCTDAKPAPGPDRFPLELSLKDGVLSEQPLGVPRYRLLANTRYAIIAEDHHGDFDPALGIVSIFVATVVIDRVTGSFSTTMSASDGTAQHRTGRCRRFEEAARASNDGVLARRN